MEEDGIKTPTGSKRWHMSTIKSVLTNEKYKGDCLLQKGYTSDFLTKKRKTNNGELPQYYIEDDHESIIDKETFDAVQVMTESRGINYSGIDIFSNKIICADCGSAFGRKVWHSNDKYRRVVYRCNNKFKSDRVGKSDNIMSTRTEKCHSIISEEKCHSMTVDEEMIKNVFVEKYNKINRKEYLKNAENIIITLDKKDENIDILRKKIENIVDEINDLVDKNATVKMNQDEYRKKHEKLVKVYEKLKVGLENKENEQKSREDRVKEIRIYIDTLKKSGINKEFNSELFAILVDKVIVSESEIKIRWKDGRES